jgi:TadE-like protein
VIILADRSRRGRSGAGQKGISAAWDDGSAPLELLILAPVILAVIGLVIAAGRTSVAQASVDAAARDAARQASISLSPAAARLAALASASAALRADGLGCKPVVTLDLEPGFSTPLGQPAQVSASVRCTVPLSDLLVPGVPGFRTLTARFVSPLDPYRSRTLGFGARYLTGESGLVEPDPVAARVTDRGAAGHAFGVMRGNDLGGASVDGAGMVGVEVLDQQPECRPAWKVHAIVVGDEMQQEEVVLAICAEDERGVVRHFRALHHVVAEAERLDVELNRAVDVVDGNLDLGRPATGMNWWHRDSLRHEVVGVADPGGQKVSLAFQAAPVTVEDVTSRGPSRVVDDLADLLDGQVVPAQHPDLPGALGLPAAVPTVPGYRIHRTTIGPPVTQESTLRRRGGVIMAMLGFQSPGGILSQRRHAAGGTITL